MKKYLYVSLNISSLIIIISILFSIINLFKISIHPSIYLISMIIISLLLGYNIGKISKDKGYLKGLISGLILITILFLISLILHANIKLITLLYYLIIIICTTLSSMIGVNKK